MITRMGPAMQITILVVLVLLGLVLLACVAVLVGTMLAKRAVDRRLDHFDNKECCQRADYLCRRFGCPLDKNWTGDKR